jgi:flavin-dependent dehydrogenase
MPVRATKRGADRTRLHGDFDVLVCGASFAGLAVARELRGTGARVLVLDRYEIGERQTSACAAPTSWLRNLGLAGSVRQTFGSLVVHTPRAEARWPLPWTFSTFDYRELCSLLWEQRGAGTVFETAKVHGRAVDGRDARGGSAATAGTDGWGDSAGGDASGATAGTDGCGAAADGGASGATAGTDGWDPPAGRGARGGAEAPVFVGVATDRGVVRAPLVVDALGWRRVLGTGANVQPPEARLSRGLEVHPHGAGDDLELWIDKRVIRAGYGWSFPAGDELRVGVGSFDPRDHVKEPTVALAEGLDLPAERYQGNWIPHRIRPAIDAGAFFAGDSAGHCLPVTAEGIRTALYFGIALGRELRAVLEGRRTRAQALSRYAAFSAAHRWKFEVMLQVQHLVPRLTPWALGGVTRALARPGIAHWAFRHYLDIAPPAFALPAPPAAARATGAVLAA